MRARYNIFVLFNHIFAKSSCALAAAIPRTTTLLSRATSNAQTPSSALFSPGDVASTAFLWSSIGLAVITALLQGLVTALAQMTETSNQWTFRFRLARIEHWWWTTVSALLMASLILIVLSFASGNNNDSVSVLLLASTTFLTIVRYMLPAWRSRYFIENRWFAWSGPSRTGIRIGQMKFCGEKSQWMSLSKRVTIEQRREVESDYYGWHFKPLGGIRLDPTDILENVDSRHLTSVGLTSTPEYIYRDGDEKPEKVSLFWGEHSGFQRRVSRAVSAMPLSLLKSQPFTSDGYAGEGLCLAMGILGRNKGLNPKKLVFNMTREISTTLENYSTWAPRPAKTLRSYYRETLQKQYGYLGSNYIEAAIELSLILMDASHYAITAWLEAGKEHQDFEVNKALYSREPPAKPSELRAHYESSYVSMIISLNNMQDKQTGIPGKNKTHVQRPDIICLGLLLKARDRNAPMPDWWDEPVFVAHRESERKYLDNGWYVAAAKLLGLPGWPEGFERGVWNGPILTELPRALGPSPLSEADTVVDQGVGEGSEGIQLRVL
jgi:hypothetical protein